MIGAGNLAQLNSTERFQQLSYCYESEGLVSLFTVYNNLAIPLLYHGLYSPKEIDRRIHETAEQLEISQLLEREPFQLNDVQKRLVNLARALVVGANVILVDEIQTGMSAEMVAQMSALLQEQAERGVTVIMITTLGDEDRFAHNRLQICNRTLEQRALQ